MVDRRRLLLIGCLGTLACASPPPGGAAPSGGSGGVVLPRGEVGPQGGSVTSLNFAVIGDTRPRSIDDTAGYPAAVIGQIYADLEAFSPKPQFAIGTGDYLYASPGSGAAGEQASLYLAATRHFSNQVFLAMGNHECTGWTSSQCGVDGADGLPDNFTAFMGTLLNDGLGIVSPTPYYAFQLRSNPGVSPSWTAKFIFVAANAWDAAQAAWLAAALQQSSTYTFVVRHEPTADDDRCIGASASTQILARTPPTLLLVGHAHEFRVVRSGGAGSAELIVGNGGAPLAGNSNYGYVVCTQTANGDIACQDYDYQSNAPIAGLTVDATGAAR